MRYVINLEWCLGASAGGVFRFVPASWLPWRIPAQQPENIRPRRLGWWAAMLQSTWIWHRSLGARAWWVSARTLARLFVFCQEALGEKKKDPRWASLFRGYLPCGRYWVDDGGHLPNNHQSGCIRHTFAVSESQDCLGSLGSRPPGPWRALMRSTSWRSIIQTWPKRSP